MQNTPQLHQKGIYEVKLPFTLKQNVMYECLAIRDFADIYTLGIDVYDTYYQPKGLVDGQDNFDFKEEAKKEPHIITLKGNDGSIEYIPDTYITRLPDETLIPYHEVVLAVPLGALPDALNLEELKLELQESAAKHLNIITTTQVGVVPLLKNPTKDEHDVLERTRLGRKIAFKPNYQQLYEEALATIEKKNLTINIILEKMLAEGIITAYTRPPNEVEKLRAEENKNAKANQQGGNTP